jgi:hypothetical protein
MQRLSISGSSIAHVCISTVHANPARTEGIRYDAFMQKTVRMAASNATCRNIFKECGDLDTSLTRIKHPRPSVGKKRISWVEL